MFRLAHISDIHLQPMPDATVHQLFSKRILGYLNWKLNRRNSISEGYLEPLIDHLKANSIDHIAVTGDLVNLSLPDEYLMGLEFLNSLGPAEDVTANCGNHDAYVPGSLARAIDSWTPYLSGDDKTISSASDYPVLRKRGDIAIIACNSAEATAPFFATGYFRRAQAQRLSSILEETEGMYRIVMIHHPPISGAAPWYKRLIGQKRFRNAVEKHGAELVLHGHTHLATRNHIAGPAGPVPVICVPAAGAEPGGIKPAGRYNLFTIEKSRTGWSTMMEEYGHTNKKDGVRLIGSHHL